MGSRLHRLCLIRRTAAWRRMRGAQAAASLLWRADLSLPSALQRRHADGLCAPHRARGTYYRAEDTSASAQSLVRIFEAVASDAAAPHFGRVRTSTLALPAWSMCRSHLPSRTSSERNTLF